MIRRFWLLLSLLVILLVGMLWKVATRQLRYINRPVKLRETGAELTIAATGDTLLLKPVSLQKNDEGFRNVVSVIQNASVSVTNLEENLLNSSNPSDRGNTNWPHGTRSQANNLRDIGFTVVSLANNHALDYGVAGLGETANILDEAGLLHTGSGQNLALARTPVYLGTRVSDRVAVIAVAVSAPSEARATYTHGEIAGRPGISGIKYSPDITLDPVTFSILQRSSAAEKGSVKPNAKQFLLSGTVVKRGKQTEIEFVPDLNDLNDISSHIKAARSVSDVVVVMLHSHEPGNLSQTPADFVEQLARKMVDSGADLVIGQGPHQLRGIEIYKHAFILYSLGNFLFDYSSVDARSADVYDGGADLYRLALGDSANAGSTAPRFEEPIWWESVIAVAFFDHGVPKSLTLRPIDLGTDLPLASRGIPKLATDQRAAEILQRISNLSKPFGTQIQIKDGVGTIVLAKQPN